MTATALNVYGALKKKLGHDDARKLVTYIEDSFDAKIVLQLEHKMEHIATKKDVSDTKAEPIKWMFIFIASQTVLFISLVKLL